MIYFPYVAIMFQISYLFLFGFFKFFITLLFADSEEALGQLLNDSADEVIEISSEEENPLEDEKECSKFVKNSSKSINEVIVKKKGISINNHMEGQIPNNQRKPRDIGKAVFLLQFFLVN